MDGIEPAVDPKKPGLFVVSTPLDFKEEDSGAEIYTGSWYDPRRVADSISESFPNARIEFVSEYEGAARHEQILNAATGYDEVVFVSFCTSTSYLGTDCLTRRTEALINAFRIAGKLEALVHFGNPLALGMIGDVSRILLGYTAPSAQKYAFEVLAGKLPARGKNPFPRLMKESREKR